MDMKSFKSAFSDRAGSCSATCACGKTFFDSIGNWTWEDGELEELQADPNAVDLEHGAGYITFEGVTYVIDCGCWHPRANKIMGFLDTHMLAIAEYFRAEKVRKQNEATEIPDL